MSKGKRKPRMSEEDKKKKFGDKYDPNFSRGQDGSECKNKSGIPGKNDWQWYALSEQIAKDIASIPYNTLSGVTVQVTVQEGIADKVTTIPAPITGVWNNQAVARIEYSPAQFANPQDTTSGIQMATTQLYTYIRHANSGARNYEPADVMMYVLGMRDIYIQYFELKRAIGVCQAFSFENRSLPDTILQACGVDAEDLRKNIAQYRGQLNIIAKKINSFAVPKYFKAFERAAYVASNVFADSDSIRGQFYVFTKVINYQVNTTGSATGTALAATLDNLVTGTQGFKLISARIATLQAAISAIEGDTDMLTMSGDILHAFKDADLYQVSETDENYTVFPAYDEDVAAQIENMYMIDADYTTFNNSEWNVTQTGGLIRWMPTFRQKTTGGVSGNAYMQRKLFNSHKDSPEFTDNLEWSRLIATYVTYSRNPATAQPGFNNYQLTSCGLEVVLGLKMFTNVGSRSQARIFQNIGFGQDLSVSGNDLLALIALEQFDWHPTVYVGRIGAGVLEIFQVNADIKKYTWIEDSIIKAIHDGAVASSFYAHGLYSS